MIVSRDIDCRTNGAPFGEEAGRLVEIFASLGGDPRYSFVRCYVAIDLLQRAKELFTKDFSVANFTALLDQAFALTQLMLAGQKDYLPRLSFSESRSEEQIDSIDDFTARHYGDLFDEFSSEEYFDIPYHMLEQRFSLNGIAFPQAKQMNVLDAGCGGGRNSCALRKMGFLSVEGIDISSLNIETARRMSLQGEVSNIQFRVCDIAAQPFEDATFDFVYCSGVLHHMSSMPEGLSECHRVLKSGGQFYLKVLEKPGGIVLDAIDIGRAVLAPVSWDYAARFVDVAGYRGFQRYNVLDHLLVPYNHRSSQEEIEQMLIEAGFQEYQRLLRGLPSDRCERRFFSVEGEEEALWKFGIGENAYQCWK